MNTAKSTNKHFYGVRRSMETTSNTLYVFLFRAIASALACFSSASFATQGVDYIEPAKYQTMDKYNVNVTGNQLSPTVETVAIGGELGLRHSITLMGNYFDLSHSLNGYMDKYAGGLRFTHLGTNKVPGYPDVPAGAGDATVMRASFLGQHADFLVVDNGGTYHYGYYAGTNYHYETLGDKRHVLEKTPDGLVWTQPDGTEVFFSTVDMTNSATAHTNFAVQKIVYPNGFAIQVGSLSGVMTNTGFALKYDFDSTDPGLDSSKQPPALPQDYFPADSNVPAVSTDFRAANPKCIRAINIAIEAYNLSTATPCSTSTKWPKATFTWPGGMPRAFFIDRSTFSVTNAANVRTDFIYEAQDAGIPTNPMIPSNTPRKLIAPRLVEIKSAGAAASTAFYTYGNKNPNVITTNNGNIVFINYVEYHDDSLLPGILTSASGALGSQGYSVGDLREYHGKSYRSGGDIAVSQYTTSPVGILEKIDDFKGDRVINFELTYRNFVTTETSFSAPTKVYYYDDNVRGNLVKVTQGSATTTAGYPATCSNRKTCNKPVWVKDPNLNETDYTYHLLSGQIETVTSPADKNGKRAQTRYEYMPLQASYLTASGTTTGSAIYLKTAEKYCMSSNYIGTGNGNSVFTGACELGASDEVVTRYEYDTTKNLHLKGKTVTAVNTAGVPTVKRTCYQYDIYNNLIGETQPNANPASCN